MDYITDFLAPLIALVLVPFAPSVQPEKKLRAGIIGLDTSHVVAFRSDKGFVIPMTYGTDVDWGRIELRLDADRWGPRLSIDMPDLSHFARQDFEATLAQARSLEELHRLVASPSIYIASIR